MGYSKYITTNVRSLPEINSKFSRLALISWKRGFWGAFAVTFLDINVSIKYWSTEQIDSTHTTSEKYWRFSYRFLFRTVVFLSHPIWTKSPYLINSSPNFACFKWIPLIFWVAPKISSSKTLMVWNLASPVGHALVKTLGNMATHLKTNMESKNDRNLLFQGSIFRCQPLVFRGRSLCPWKNGGTGRRSGFLLGPKVTFQGRLLLNFGRLSVLP